jgi:hypothetical protein
MRLPLALLACAALLGAAGLVGTSCVASAGTALLPLDTVTPAPSLLPRSKIVIAPDLEMAASAAEAFEGEIPSSTGGSPPPTRPVAVEYSDSYNLRRKVHYIASFATLPLFATEYALGAKLYNGSTSGSVRSAHGFVASSMGVLFGVNTLTGVWNMYETRHEPTGRTRRILHGALMLVAEGGFVATGMNAPESEEGSQPVGTSAKNKHRAMALGSMGVATASYVIMLIGR